MPSPPTFCRTFTEFATGKLPQVVHEAMIKNHCGQKLAGHISRDSTAIESREKPVKTPNLSPKQKENAGDRVRAKLWLPALQSVRTLPPLISAFMGTLIVFHAIIPQSFDTPIYFRMRLQYWSFLECLIFLHLSSFPLYL